MPKRKHDDQTLDLFNLEDRLKTAVCVPAIRSAFKEWRGGKYKGVTETTGELLNFWFHTDHQLPNGEFFKFHDAQREAIETLIFLFEIVKIRTRTELLEKYAVNVPDLRLPPYDEFARYCLKMATGSGKTLVMAMSIVWQFANHIRGGQDYANNFLIIAPNVIVFDRLRSDFESGQVFRTLPLIPKHLEWLWEMEYYMRGDTERTNSQGALYLTNIQQFYERATKAANIETDIMTAMLGSLPPSTKTEISDFDDRIANRDGLVMVLNDEAHHTHDEDSEWNRFIRNLHARRPITAQLDFSATPRYSAGSLFAWTVFDYPLKQAILDGIVKRPIKGISRIEEAKSNIANVKYQGFLTAGVQRWKEYKDQLESLQKKPILFVMMNNTEEADDIGDWLRTKYPAEFGGEKTLVIHTDKSGEVSKKDLDGARKMARDVDHDSSPVNAIVSVLMLREGWDVQNVTVVVGLRPYSAKANILPEQTIGRGLRLMFRNLAGDYTERVDIIGNKAFMEFVEDLEKLEDLKFDTFEIGKEKLTILTIQPMEDKAAMDIGIPDISPILSRKQSLAEEIEKIDVMKFNVNRLPMKKKGIEEVKTFVYEGRDILTDEKLLEREYSIPPAQTSEEVIGYYARRIAQNIKLPSQFSVLAPKIRDFFEKKAFGETVDLFEQNVIQAMSSNVASYVVINVFEKALREVIVEQKEPELLSASRVLSETPPFPTSKKVIESKRTIFNYVPCDNEFELAFANFLDTCEDVKMFAKLPTQFGFSIHYTDTLANIRNYFPDFIAITKDGTKWVIETKGREDIDVRLKDNAAISWCENATELTDETWQYIKVPQKEFEALHPDGFEEMIGAINPPTLFD
ncbi:MAG: DEAD/DEAH box helicase family protein [Pyrinomonadaceae bacterium]|nr:DEAD/DEAH box helicase family protein [Pyrinomonadaceae bacterium]MBP6212713.1 DEAD/DEAH box helicase family protein [Pyrinomonadaceae bacterium]